MVGLEPALHILEIQGLRGRQYARLVKDNHLRDIQGRHWEGMMEVS